MPYIGNTIRAADDYRLIDDISSGFNGSTTSFALQVAGSAPVPFPKSPQQVLISVNGVIQEPDPTGASGFNLVGTNIVFSSAPTNGHAFFGIIYATADYLNSGGNFPTGSLGAPSITFVGDEDTGIYRKGSGSVGFVSDATEIANFDSNGITISSGNIIIPDSIIHNGDTNTKIRFPAADTITAETGGTERQRINSDGQLLINQTASSGLGRQLQIGSNTGFGGVSLNRFSADTGSSGLDFIKSRNATIGSNTIVQNDDNLGAITWRGADGTDFATPAAQIKVAVDGTPGSNDMPGRIMLFTTADGASSLTERLRIDNAGNVGIGITNPTTTLHLDASGGAVLQLQRTSSNASNRLAISHDGTDGTLDSSNALLFRNNGAERARITSAGRLGIGTTNPDAKLKINGSSAYTVANSGRSVEGLDIQATAGGSGNFGGAISLGSSGSGRSAIAALQDGADSDRTGLVFITHDSNTAADNSAEKMRIDSTGRVGIGTTSPNAKLYIAEAGSNTGGDINLNADGLVVDNSGGNTGLTFKTPNTASSRIAFGDPEDNNAGQILYSQASNYFAFDTAGSERMRIDSSGRVGIGTSSMGSHQLISEGGKAETGGSCLALKTSGGANSITSALALYGTFVTPTNDQATRRTADIISGFATGNWGNEFLAFNVGKGGSSNDTQAVTDERMRITGAGNVGIGITSPTSTLHVSGDVRTTNRLGVGTAANFANIVSYVTGTGSYPPSGGLVQADNADSTAMFWNASNSANYTGLSIECRTTGAAYWMLANVYNSSFSGDLAFRTRTGGSANAERVRFRREGGITFNGDTAAANALDDYEEGTWTVTFGPGASEFTPTSNTSTGFYTKIGRQVTVIGIATMDTPASLGSYNNANINYALSISGLPFTIYNSTQARSVAVIGVGTGAGSPDGVLATHGNNNNTKLSIFVNKDNGGVRVSPTLTTSTTVSYHFQFTYFTS